MCEDRRAADVRCEGRRASSWLWVWRRAPAEACPTRGSNGSGGGAWKESVGGGGGGGLTVRDLEEDHREALEAEAEGPAVALLLVDVLEDAGVDDAATEDLATAAAWRVSELLQWPPRLATPTPRGVGGRGEGGAPPP